MFQHKTTGHHITGYREVKASWSALAPPAPAEPSHNHIVFTFSSTTAKLPSPPPPTFVERIVLPPLRAPFRHAFDEVMSRLFRRKPTALDLVMRNLFAKYECNWITVAHISMVVGEHGMVLTSPLQLVACQTGPAPVHDSWGHYFPYFDAQEIQPHQWYFSISTLFYTLTQ